MPLKRPQHGRMIAGVCAGIAQHLGWSAARVRLVYIGFSIISAAFPGILVYLLMWFLMPNDDA